jgi:hypothetical protein
MQMTPTNKLRWLNVPAEAATQQVADSLVKNTGCSYVYALTVMSKPATRTLQQWWEYPQGGAGEWRNIEEVEEK